MPSKSTTSGTKLATIASNLLLPLLGTTRAQSTTPFRFYSFIGEDFFADNQPNEASGLDISPDGTHLVGVSDDGKIFFLNLLDYTSGHCMIDLSNNEVIDGDDDFEGVAIDTGSWTVDNKHAYVVHEGGEDDEPYLFKMQYEYDNDGDCSIKSIERTSLLGAIPCLTDSNGIESLGLKTPSSGSDNPAVFFAGVQDTGKVYEVTSDGWSNGPQACYDAGIGKEDVAATAYDGQYLWSFLADEDTLAVVDPIQYCTVAVYEMAIDMDQEGLVIDVDNRVMYAASDEQGDAPSLVAVYNLTYPEDIGECLGEYDSIGLCTGFDVCEGTFPPTPAMVVPPAATTLATPAATPVTTAPAGEPAGTTQATEQATTTAATMQANTTQATIPAATTQKGTAPATSTPGSGDGSSSSPSKSTKKSKASKRF
eukprot:CAMPEP_0183703882 /NCGR_PEP_ID=MMETSP0737-20130205/1441_1 /TAXON_ID=385413 /ORGANISM="Thalassiosira miniscula, Strain CCMP1093" /LENGTH=422 /DNA_ID=CAMNT_0025930683 /DNA_START=142 /DNA_END=1410 /DNA_ORIENTATION=+